MVQNKRTWDVPEVDDLKDQQLNVPKIIVGHRVTGQVEDDTLCRVDVDPIVVEKLIVHHVVDEFINNDNEQFSVQSRSSDAKNNNKRRTITNESHIQSKMSNFPVGFNEAMIYSILMPRSSIVPGTSSVGDISEYIELVTGSLQHQMLTMWKEFRGQNYRHFKKAARAKQSINHSSGAKLFLQRQLELAEHPIDRIELFRKTHAQGGQFVSQATADSM
ncbi:CACTA en-spm transposon protein [Cucumis melo var. makuwa]|uniref:CACTA en-spm transposon protein n=1 Tax=Cucumis melo var. makuwa TaxID=1194695 RepID=A0A5A7U3P5_CUCMM|nr:CACTA en-spm transposon protein [Cucumis melo var. makuwa]